MIAVMPGVVKDRTGNLHFHGSPSEEINWLLDGHNLADPASGRLEADLSVEAVKSLDLFSGRYSVAFGKGSGGTMLINSATGDNAFKLRTTNFIPGLEQSKGLTLSSWRPKVSLSGPIKKDAIWFFSGSDLNLKQNIIAELPRDQDRSLNWAASNLLRIQANLSPSHVLSSDVLLNYFVAPRSGLSALDPVETTLNRRAYRYFVGFKDQVALPRILSSNLDMAPIAPRCATCRRDRRSIKSPPLAERETFRSTPGERAGATSGVPAPSCRPSIGLAVTNSPLAWIPD